LNDSTYAFCHGLPGSMYSVPHPLSFSHAFTASAMNSGPLSERTNRGAPRSSNRYFSVATTSRAVKCRSTSIARHSRVNSSTTGSSFRRLPSDV
jgi:hypothetical protein